MNRIVWYTLIVLATLLSLLLLWQVREALGIFLLSLMVAAILRPLVERLVRRGLARSLALATTYIFSVGLLVLMLIVGGGALLGDLERASNDLAVAYERAKNQWPQSSSVFLQTVAGQLPPPDELYKALAGGQGMALAQAMVGVASNLAGVVSKLVIALVLSVYWSIDYVYFERLWLSLLSVHRRARARNLWREVEGKVGGYIRSELAQSFLVALLLWGEYYVIGLPYPTLLAVFAALARLIPWLGPMLAVLAPLLVGFLFNLPLGVVAALYTILVFVLVAYLGRRFLAATRYSSLLMVFLIVAFAQRLGLVGAILAPPVAVAVQVLFSHVLPLPGTATTTITPVNELSNLRARLLDVRARMVRGEAPSSPVTNDLMARLEKTVQQASVLLER